MPDSDKYGRPLDLGLVAEGLRLVSSLRECATWTPDVRGYAGCIEALAEAACAEGVNINLALEEAAFAAHCRREASVGREVSMSRSDFVRSRLESVGWIAPMEGD